MSLTKDVKFGPVWTLHVDVSIKIRHFLLPAGGARIIMEYWPLDMFRPGLLSNLISLGKIVHLWLSYNNFYSHGETSNLSGRHGHAL